MTTEAERTYDLHLRRIYGITLEDYRAMARNQASEGRTGPAEGKE